jgi:hypothetical protein
MKIDIQNRSKITKIINGAIISAINDHGPITEDNYSSASKRVYGELKCLAKNQRDIDENIENNINSQCLADTFGSHGQG